MNPKNCRFNIFILLLLILLGSCSHDDEPLVKKYVRYIDVPLYNGYVFTGCEDEFKMVYHNGGIYSIRMDMVGTENLLLYYTTPLLFYNSNIGKVNFNGGGYIDNLNCVYKYFAPSHSGSYHQNIYKDISYTYTNDYKLNEINFFSTFDEDNTRYPNPDNPPHYNTGPFLTTKSLSTYEANVKIIWENDIISKIINNEHLIEDKVISDNVNTSQKPDSIHIDEQNLIEYHFEYSKLENESLQIPISISSNLLSSPFRDWIGDWRLSGLITAGITGYGPRLLPSKITVFKNGDKIDTKDIEISQKDIKGIKVIDTELYDGDTYRYLYEKFQY